MAIEIETPESRSGLTEFVEFHGPGLADMPLANRATIANMAPEYGATVGFFPVDEQTTRYMRLTGRDDKLIDTVEQYYKIQGMWRDETREITYSDVLELDMSTVEPSLAGPKRPQDRIALSGMRDQWDQDLSNVKECHDLPLNAQNYVILIEELTKKPVTIIGVGPKRKQTIFR